MTAPLPPGDKAKLDALLRERYGDPQELASERDRPIPLPPGMAVGARRRGAQPQQPAPERMSYGEQHASIRAWLHREHPSWLPELYTLSDAVAHVVIQRETPTYALALCGASGFPHAAPDIAPPCRTCASFRPRS